jgi:hypothetical protein
MLGTIILMFIFFWIISLLGGILLGKLFWTPPVKGVK